MRLVKLVAHALAVPSLIVLGIAALIVLIFPQYILIGVFATMGLGLPIGILCWAIPAIFVIAMSYFLLSKVMPYRNGRHVVAVSASIALVLVIPAQIINLGIWGKVHNLVRSDHNNLQSPVRIKSIAVRKKYSFGRGITPCGGFCLHALLTGSAERVLLVHGDRRGNMKDVPDLSDDAIEFSFKKSATCPAVKFTPGHHSLKIPRDRSSKKRYANAIEAMKLRISNGDCLISRPAKLRDSDMIITVKRLMRGVSNADIGFNIFNNTITADRISVHVPAQDELKEVYRWTGVQYKPLVMLLPAPMFGYQFDMGMGWLRVDRDVNIENKFYEHPDWTNFLTKTLGFNLELDGAQSETRILAKIEHVLDENRPPSREEWQAFDAYYELIGISDNSKPNNRNFDLALRMLETTAFPPTKRLYAMARFAADMQDEQMVQRLAAALMNKINMGQTWSDDLGVSRKSALRTLAFGVNVLPESAFESHFKLFTKLAFDPEVREHAYIVFKKLSAFGGRSATTLLNLIDDGLAGGKHFFRTNKYQHPYLAGIGGLCLAGDRATIALSRMMHLLKEKNLPVHSSYGDLVINTLIRLGADPEHLWSLFSSSNNNVSRKHFDVEVLRARSDRPDCDY